MGSKVAPGLAWGALLFAETGAGAVELNDVFADEEQIESWADAYYFGGHKLQSFELARGPLTRETGRFADPIYINQPVSWMLPIYGNAVYSDDADLRRNAAVHAAT